MAPASIGFVPSLEEITELAGLAGPSGRRRPASGEPPESEVVGELDATIEGQLGRSDRHRRRARVDHLADGTEPPSRTRRCGSTLPWSPRGSPTWPAVASEMEAAGYDGAFTFEGPHDPFLPLVLAADATERLELTTAVAIALARNPMTFAHQAWDLQALSGGRFHLGLGSQVKAHIERRFSMPWTAPARRMRELVLAVRAIWATWQDRTPLRFEGEHYTHTLMTPFFDPGPARGRPATDLARRRGPADDRGRRRGGRRLHGPPVLHRAVAATR